MDATRPYAFRGLIDFLKTGIAVGCEEESPETTPGCPEGYEGLIWDDKELIVNFQGRSYRVTLTLTPVSN